MTPSSYGSSVRYRPRSRPADCGPVTSGRRWEHNGVLRTILLMWRLRLSYYLGVEPALLAELYDAPRSPA